MKPTLEPASPPRDHAEARVGIMFGLACYGWWGLVPIYFKAVRQVPAAEVLAHRVIWSVVLLAVLMRLYRRWGAAGVALRQHGSIALLACTTVLIAANWFTFIWAVANDHVLQASLGYYINPLVNVLLGFVVLKERLRRAQLVSVGLAAVGVIYLAVQLGEWPIVALFLAFTFGFYGLLRKIARVDALTGLTIETGFLLIPALAYLVFLGFAAGAEGTDSRLVFGHHSRAMDALLMLGGVITAVPLLWFANAARRLRLATIGFLQYIAPSVQFLLAVAVYGERFTTAHLVSFVCIWSALAIYTADAWRVAKRAASAR